MPKIIFKNTDDVARFIENQDSSKLRELSHNFEDKFSTARALDIFMLIDFL